MHKKHVMIPDTQLRPNSAVEHIAAAANYITDKKPDVISIIGDWWDMSSLCSYDKPGAKDWEAKDVKADFEIGCDQMAIFLGKIKKEPKYKPEVHFFEGNHEERVMRAAADPYYRKFSGWLNRDQFCFDKYGVKVEYHPFLEIQKIDGICYSHYFLNPDSLYTNSIGGTIENKLRKLGHSFSMGHQQHKQFGSVYTATGERRVGLVCGRFYQDYHEYLGPQKNYQSWSGILMKHEVRNGDYDLMEVSMDYLIREWQ